MKKTQIKSKKIYVILFCLLTFIFVFPSIIYMIKNKTSYQFNGNWTYLFRDVSTHKFDEIKNTIAFMTIFTGLFILYLFIMKKHKQIFKNKKQIMILIIVISILFLMIIPYTSADFCTYIAKGWLGAHYGENPYYVTTGQAIEMYGENDPILNIDPWKNETTVYGPLWAMICTVLSFFSFGNFDIALLLFKLANVIVHIANCVLIYKITKKNMFVILYEAIANVHNDIFVVLFILLALYFLLKKKSLFWAVAFTTMAILIKYFAVLLLPFIVLYAVRNKDIKQRIKCCIFCIIEFVSIALLFYLFYLRDFEVLKGLFIQQQKYRQSIFLILFYILVKRNVKLFDIIQNVTFISFAVYYIYVVIRLLLQKEMKFYEIIRKYQFILVLFTFILITNFNAWYIMWLFPTVFWLKKNNIKDVLYISYAGEFATIFYFIFCSEAAMLGVPYIIILLGTTFILDIFGNKRIKILQGVRK